MILQWKEVFGSLVASHELFLNKFQELQSRKNISKSFQLAAVADSLEFVKNPEFKTKYIFIFNDLDAI